MKEPYKQGIANQFGPESCASPREGAGEALTGGSSGQPLSSEINLVSVPTQFCHGEGNTFSQRNQDRELTGDATESENLSMNDTLISRKPGDLGGSLRRSSPMGRLEKAVPNVHHARRRGVGRLRSTVEAGEQRRNSGSGARGGKGVDQGKRHPTGRGPDTEPVHRVVQSQRRTASRAASAVGRHTQGRSRMR